MRSRVVLPVLGWCAATLASIALASVALLPVLRTGTPSTDAPAAGLAVAPVATVVPEPTSTPSAAPTSAGGAASSRPPSGAGRSPTVPPPSQPVKVVDGWTVTTGDDGEPVYVRSFRVDGGQAVIRMTGGRVHLVTATPSAGYTVTTTQSEPGNLAVQFTEQNHYFVIHALWHNNAPFAQVSEVGS
jgi:hypothetical protein